MANGNCRVPNCESEVHTRGLCAKHWYRAFKGRAGPRKDEAIQYALPSSRGHLPAGRQDGKPEPGGGVENLKKNIARARQQNNDAEKDPRVDARIAAVTMFATAMGIRRVENAGGFLFVGADDTSIILTSDGEIREATLTIGDVLR